jgi:hypothetical protein
MVTHIISHYLPISATIVGEKLTLLYTFQLHEGNNMYYINNYRKFFNSNVIAKPNLFGLYDGKIIFEGNIVNNKYEGILEQMRIEFEDEDTKVLEEYKQLVLCVARQPKKPIDNISKVLTIEDGYMIDLCLTKSMLAEETIYYGDFIHCKLRNTSDEIITYVNKIKLPKPVIKKPNKFKLPKPVIKKPKKTIHTFYNRFKQPMIQMVVSVVLGIGLGKIVKAIIH